MYSVHYEYIFAGVPRPSPSVVPLAPCSHSSPKLVYCPSYLVAPVVARAPPLLSREARVLRQEPPSHAQWLPRGASPPCWRLLPLRRRPRRSSSTAPSARPATRPSTATATSCRRLSWRGRLP